MDAARLTTAQFTLLLAHDLLRTSLCQFPLSSILVRDCSDSRAGERQATGRVAAEAGRQAGKQVAQAGAAESLPLGRQVPRVFASSFSCSKCSCSEELPCSATLLLSLDGSASVLPASKGSSTDLLRPLCHLCVCHFEEKLPVCHDFLHMFRSEIDQILNEISFQRFLLLICVLNRVQ